MFQNKEQQTNPVKAIRANCLECMGGSSLDVKNCGMEGRCQLWPFRLGKNSFRKKRELTEEQKAAMAKRLQKNRDSK